MAFDRLLDNEDWTWDYEGIFVHPHIPMKKLVGAIDSYAPSVSPNDIVVLVDDTVFGGAREGMVVTKDGLYSKQKFESAKSIRWSDIRDISPHTNARILVNDGIFFDANIVDHFAILTLAARLSGCLSNSVETAKADKPGRANGESEPPALEKLRRLHSLALSRFKRDLEDAYGDVSDLELDRLVDTHFEILSEVTPQIYKKVITESPRDWSQARKDVETANVVLMAFILFHCTSFTKMPTWLRNDLGDTYLFLAGAHMIYRDAFLEEVQGVFGLPPDRDQESLEILALIFMSRDGDSNVHLKIPREEALSKFIQFLGVTGNQVSAMNEKFEAALAGWWQEIEEQVLDEDSDDPQDDENFAGPFGSDGPHTSTSTPSHSDILGVRPGASMAEIDLAYKGRRSQYHPDRYAKEGEEAVRWATERMKEVNAAYDALKYR